MSHPLVPFEAEVAGAAIADLRERLARTRWPDPEPVDDWSQGVPTAYMRDLCGYWRDGYDMRRVADRLNRYPQYTTEIDGVHVHFLHVRSPVSTAVPLVITHGWPGSVVEFLDVIDALADPVSHGGQECDAFHLVIPSIPGFGFSGKPRDTGWTLGRITSAWATLMRRLGYERYAAQGGDWGGAVAMALGIQDAPRLEGIHLNIALGDPSALEPLGGPTDEEAAYFAERTTWDLTEVGYSIQQRSRPQTLGYGLADSPAGQCAWVVEKFRQWSDCDGDPESVFTRDALLDNVMVYWLNNAGASSARLYWESARATLSSFPPVVAPVAYSVFPREFERMSERWARTRFPDLRYYRQVERGGHFAAMERPDAFVAEVRAGFRAIRGLPAATTGEQAMQSIEEER